MHILYDPATLAVLCVMLDCHEVTAAHNRTLPNHVEHAERIPHHLIHLEPHPTDPSGKPIVSRKREFEARLDRAAVRVGEAATIAPIPEGTEIAIGGVACGAMDATQALEFTPEVGGAYRIQLSLRGWLTLELTLEAVP